MADDNSIMSFLQGASMRGNNDNCFGGYGLFLILFFVIFGGWGNAFGGRNMNCNGIEQGQSQILSQMGFDTLINGIRGLERGLSDTTFANLNALNQIGSKIQDVNNSINNCCCSMKGAINEALQTVLSKLCESEKSELRDKLFAASQREQTAAIITALKTPTTTTA